MWNIVSLQLLSKHISDLCGIEIIRDDHLSEVIFDSEILQLQETKTVQEQAEAAKNHPNRPQSPVSQKG